MGKQKLRNTKSFRKKLKVKINKIINEPKSINNLFSVYKVDKLVKMSNVKNPSKDLVDKCNKLSKEIIKSIINNKEEILFRLKDYNNRIEMYKLFQYHILYPYFLIGNKYMEGFDEFYEFLSKINFWFDKSESITLFRCMDEDEYMNLLSGGGVESPSYSENPTKIIFLKNSNTLVNLDRKNIFVCCNFNTDDIISKLELTSENEVLIKKGSVPNFIYKYSEFGKEDLIDDLGEDVLNYLPLLPSEIGNGFNYMDSLKEKGFEYKREHIYVGNQIINLKQSNWSTNYYKGLIDVIDKVCLLHPNYNLTILKDNIEFLKSQFV